MVTTSFLDGVNFPCPRRALIVAAWSLVAGLLAFPINATAGDTKNILIFRGESPELPASRLLIDGIEAAVRKTDTTPPEVYLETIDAGSLASTETYEARLAGLLEEKYRDVPLSLVVAFSEPAIRFV